MAIGEWRGGWVRFHPDDDILRLFGPVIASVIKLSKALAEVPRKVERGVWHLQGGWRREGAG